MADVRTSAVAEAVTGAFDHQAVYEEVKDKPLRVRRVDASRGLQRTRQYIVDRLLEPLYDADTLEQLNQIANDVTEGLLELGIFDTVQALIKESEPHTPGTCDMVFSFREKDWKELHVGAYVTGQEANLEFSVGETNLLGGAESAKLSCIFGSRASTELALTLSQPRFRGLPATAELTLHQKAQSFQQWSSYIQIIRGGEVSLTSDDAAHSVSYELAWRTLSLATPAASERIRGQMGHSLLSALAYRFRHSTLDDPIFPTRGFGLMSESKVAGLWADPRALRFVRQELHGQLVTAFSERVVLSLVGGAGVMLPWGPDWEARSTCISDRFLLGGVGNGLRGFSHAGCGPTDARREEGDPPTSSGRDSLKGDLYCSLLAALRVRLPLSSEYRGASVYAHAFVNGGNNVLLGGAGRPLRACLTDFQHTFSVSAGIGVVLPLSVGDLEVSLVRILRHQPHDKWRHGLHVGFSPRLW